MRRPPLSPSAGRIAPSFAQILARSLALISAATALAFSTHTPAAAATDPAKPTRKKAQAAATPANTYEVAAAPRGSGRIDELVFARLKELNIKPAHVCTDAVFVRRAFLDVIGTLPTVEETRGFLQDKSPDKRTALIDQLLARPEFADYWTMKWSDLLRVKAEFPINLWPNAAQAYHHWIHTAVRDNIPFDRFARELLTSSGSNFRIGPVNFYRASQSKEPAALARVVALTFMGVRGEKWPAERLAAVAPFFSALSYKGTGEWKEEIVFFDAAKIPATPAALPDGTPVKLSSDRDPREVFADWLITPANPWFTRAITNRVWSWLLGRGIVDEADDIRPDNPPSNPALLDHLAAELITAKYDVKKLFRLILTSETYQLSSIARSDRPEAEANFAFYPLRRLDAEVLIDALNQLSGTTEKYSSAIPEPFTYVPDDQRSIALPDGSITSSFLESFGRPSRDTGLEAERNNRITANQRLYLLNSTHIQRKIEQGPKLQALLRARPGPREFVDNIYYTILSRPPTDDERRIVGAYVLERKDPRTAAFDVIWSLINSAEFLYRH